MKEKLQYETILKIDVDVKMTQKLLSDFIETRKAILTALNFEIRDIKYVETRKGYHFWFVIDKPLQVHRRAEIQFLLGDDHNRAFYNFVRANGDSFDYFNALFSKKVRSDDYDTENKEEGL
jgi:hypothetical protein